MSLQLSHYFFQNFVSLIMFVFLFSFITTSNIAFAANNTSPISKKLSPSSNISNNVSFKKLNILSKFPDKKSANNLVYSLNRSGQKVRIVEKEIDVSLKSLSIGLFLTRMRADHVVKRLKKNHIDAFVHELKNKKFRVYAGAMRDENNYWERYEKLLSLGYKKPHTSIKIVQVTEYYVVSDKKEVASFPKKLKYRITKEKNKSNFTTSLHRAHFKGEFSIWGDQGKRSSGNYFSAALSLRTKYKSNFDFTYGVRFDATEQSSKKNLQKFEFQWRPIYLRYSTSYTSVSYSPTLLHSAGKEQIPKKVKQQWLIGAIDARWQAENTSSDLQPPRMQHDNLSDRLSSKILTRYKLDDEIIERRRPVFGLRWIFSDNKYDIDVIWTPVFRPAKLPDFGSVWHPVRRADGAIRGIKPTDTWKALVQQGSFANDKLDSGAVGVRFAQMVGRRTRSITLQYVRQSEPYYVLNPEIQRLLMTGRTLSSALKTQGYTFTPEHPYTGVITWEESGKTSHFEIAILSNTPITTTDYAYKTALSIEWKLGFTSPKSTRKYHVSGYFIGRHINTNDKILDRKTKLAITGDLYQISKGNLWKISSHYEIGLDSVALFLNPRLTFQQSKYVQVYLNYLLFTGAENTESGYHTGDSVLSLTWKAAF